MFPYKIKRVQQLLPKDLTERKQFDTWCFDNTRSDLTSLRRTTFLMNVSFAYLGLRTIETRGSGDWIIRIWYKSMRSTGKRLNYGALHTRTAS